MYKYIINKNPQIGGEHEVHKLLACNNLPNSENRIEVGNFDSCEKAIEFAKNKWSNTKIDGCKHCVPRCHRI